MAGGLTQITIYGSQDKVFWFKAVEREFKFGSKVFRDVHKRYYDPDYMKKSYQKFINDTMLFKKKNDVDNDIEKV